MGSCTAARQLRRYVNPRPLVFLHRCGPSAPMGVWRPSGLPLEAPADLTSVRKLPSESTQQADNRSGPWLGHLLTAPGPADPSATRPEVSGRACHVTFNASQACYACGCRLFGSATPACRATRWASSSRLEYCLQARSACCCPRAALTFSLLLCMLLIFMLVLQTPVSGASIKPADSPSNRPTPHAHVNMT